MPRLALALLGPFQAWADGRPIAVWKSAKVKALLSYLAAEAGRPHPRRLLAGLLWPDYSDASALGNLRDALASLRAAVADDHAHPPFLLVTRDAIQFNVASDSEIDVLTLARLLMAPLQGLDVDVDGLERAVALYRGPFMDGFSIDSPAFEEWVLLSRERISREVMDALRRLALHYEGRGDSEQTIRCARRELELEPWDEDAHRQLMRGLVLGGQHAAAIGHYHACRHLLARELNIEPDPATTTLYESIRSGLTLEPARTRISGRSAVPAPALPCPLTSFVGRAHELEEIGRLLTPLAGRTSDHTRLLTLTGAGGAGKTRLALEAGRRLTAAHCPRDGVWWVDLAGLEDPARVPQTAATALGLRESPGSPLIATLTGHLRSKEQLLVLDNCEHLIGACAEFASALLGRCEGLQILATSREALGVPGELLWRMSGLGLPETGANQLPPAEDLVQCDAIRLFAERARAADPGWQLSDHAAAVTRICTRLDGMPLAIELAAARLTVLSADEIAERLDDRFRLLVDSGRGALPRHRTLRAAIDWSYDLLTEGEQRLLRCLSAFAGGWTLEAAEEVAGDEAMDPHAPAPTPYQPPEPAVLDHLAALVNKSLVVVEQRDRRTRYRLLETVRHYALAKLNAAGEAEHVRSRHADFFVRLAETAAPGLVGDKARTWLTRLKVEHDNLRAAWAWVIEHDPGAALRLADSLINFWGNYGFLSEGREWLSRLLASIEDWGIDARRARALNAAGTMATIQLDYAAAATLFMAGRAIAEATGDEREAGFALLGLGEASVVSGDYPAAHTYLDAALILNRATGNWRPTIRTLLGRSTLAREEGDLSPVRGYAEEAMSLARAAGDSLLLGRGLCELGMLAELEGDYGRATACYESALDVSKELPEAKSDVILRHLAEVAIHRQDLARAQELLERSLVLDCEQGRQLGITWCLRSYALLASAKGQWKQAARLTGAANAMSEALGVGARATQRIVDEQIRNGVLAALGEAAFAQALAEGGALTVEEAMQSALHGAPPDV